MDSSMHKNKAQTKNDSIENLPGSSKMSPNLIKSDDGKKLKTKFSPNSE